MLEIRPTQMGGIADSLIRAFEDRTYAHLKECFPRHCLLLGETQMRRAIQLGWRKAKAYDLTPECCVRSYIELMCRLGSGFDTDPLMPWAARILNDKVSFGQVERGDRLYGQAWDYIDYIVQDYRDPAGQPTTARFMGGLRALRHGRDDVLTQSAYPAFARELIGLIETTFPAKYRYVGERRGQRLITRGVRSARIYGIETERGVILFTVLMFVLGSGFADDPLLPWASAALEDQGIANGIARTDRLYTEGVGFLNRWWGSAPEQGG